MKTSRHVIESCICHDADGLTCRPVFESVCEVRHKSLITLMKRSSLWYLPGALLSAVCCIFLFDGRVCVHLQAFPFHGLVVLSCLAVNKGSKELMSRHEPRALSACSEEPTCEPEPEFQTSSTRQVRRTYRQEPRDEPGTARHEGPRF